ncbi:MAG: hypothetical protein QW318_06325 [Candidatus Caldarchaeum sp.]
MLNLDTRCSLTEAFYLRLSGRRLGDDREAVLRGTHRKDEAYIILQSLLPVVEDLVNITEETLCQKSQSQTLTKPLKVVGSGEVPGTPTANPSPQ